MKIRLMIFGLVMSYALVASASERIRVTESRDENGKSTYWFITKERLSKIPELDTRSPLPLPVENAVSKATEWIEARHAKFTEWDLASIGLSKIWDSDLKNRWFYNISMSGTIDVDGIKACSCFFVVILMDGTIVKSTEKE